MSDDEVFVRYTSPQGRVYQRRGVVNFAQRRVSWGGPSEIDRLFDKAQDTMRNRTLRVSAIARSPYPPGTLWASLDGELSLIRYPQVCFVEWQRFEYLNPIFGAQRFGALPADDYADLPPEIRSEKIIRGWGFNLSHSQSGLIPQIPATDRPFDLGYENLMTSLEAVE